MCSVRFLRGGGSVVDLLVVAVKVPSAYIVYVPVTVVVERHRGPLPHYSR